MKKLLLLIITFFVALAIHAQQTIYLNNGNVFKGKVVEDTDLRVKLKLESGTVVEYQKSEIKSIQNTEKAMPAESTEKKFVDYKEHDKGYYTAVELNFGGALGNYSMMNLDLQWVNGYRFNEFIKVGIGFAARYYLKDENRFIEKDSIISKGKQFAFPIYVDIRGNFMAQKTRMFTPYWSFNVGYIIRDNFFFSPTVGMKFGQKRHNFLVGLSYTGQISKVVPNIIPADKPLKNRFINILAVKIAYEF